MSFTIYYKIADNTSLHLRNNSATGYTAATIYDYSPPPWMSNSNINNVIIDNTLAPTSCYQWFYGFTNLKSIINLNNINTNNIINMESMFYACSSLTSLDLSNFDTSRVEYMSAMFHSCSSLRSLYLGNWNTSSVRFMNSMFNGCSSLTSLDISSFNTSNVTNMGHMFYNCSSLTSLNLSNFDTSNVRFMDHMFYGCSSLTSLNLSNFDTSKVEDMNYMFNKCSLLTNLDLSNFNTSSVKNMSGMFNYCGSLSSIIFGNNWDTAKVEDMYCMFQNCSSLTSLDLSNFNTSNVKDMEFIFNSCESLSRITFGSNWKTINVKSMRCMFQNCPLLTSLDLSSWNTIDNVTTNNASTNMRLMFWGCSSLTSLNLSNFDTSKVEDMNQMFYNCSSLTSLDLSSFNTSNVKDMKYMFSYCRSLPSITFGNNWDTSKVETMEYMFQSSSLTSLDLSSWNTSNVKTMEGMFNYCESLSGITFGSNWKTSKVETMYRMFQQCSSLTSLDLSSWTTANNVTTSMGRMFNNCSSLTSLNLSNFNTSNVEDMNYMFFGCSLLTSLDLSSFDTAKVENMYCMFYGCSSLTSLDISSFNTSNVLNMSFMFNHCESLPSITFGSNWNTSKVTNMYCIFQACFSLNELDISRWDTHNVTNMGHMFWRCESLPSITFGNNWNTSMVTDMNSMFQQCYLLTSLDLSSWDTSNATNMLDMFYGCSSLSSLNLSSWNTNNVTNMSGMFNSCENLTFRFTINGKQISNVENMFIDTKKDILLLGDAPNLNLMAETANNKNVKVWRLSNTFSAQRDDSLTSNIDILLTVNRPVLSTFSNSIKIHLTIDGIEYIYPGNNNLIFYTDENYTQRFTGTVTESSTKLYAYVQNMDENIAHALSVYITDDYGNSSTQYSRIPISYYTMDVLKGGKEIAFGVVAIGDDVYKQIESLEYVYFTGEYMASNDTTQEVGKQYYRLTNYKKTTDTTPGDGKFYFTKISDVDYKYEFVDTEDNPSELKLYELEGDNTYQSVSGTIDGAIPVDWNWYETQSKEFYKKEGLDYNKLISKPQDWNTNYASYYELRTTQGVFKCGMEAIFRDRVSPNVFKTMYDLMYPVGSLYTSSSASINPKTLFGGEWQLVDKEFTPAWRDFSPYWHPTYTAGTRKLVGIYTGHTMELRGVWGVKEALSDTSHPIFSIPWKTLGLNVIDHAVYCQVNCDGHNAIGIGIFTNYQTFNSSSVVTSTDTTKAGITIHDWITRSSTYPAASTSYPPAAFSIIYNCYKPSNMINSFCSKFIWKRIS